MIPTRRLVLIAGAPLVVAFAAVVQPPLAWAALAIDVVLFVVALLDLLLTRGTVTASRSYGVVQAIGRTFDIELTVENAGLRSARLRVTDTPPGDAHGLPASMALGAGQRATVRYATHIDRRGGHAFGPVCVRFLSPLGLWERQVNLPVANLVRVYPDFAQLRTYDLRARADDERRPVRTRRRPGGESEFERLRPYVPGDPYRHIDWRATARRGDFVTREFGQEVNQNVILMLDCGRMMSAANGALTSFDHALNAALMMGQVALRHGDRVGMLVFDDKVRAWLPPRGGARAGSRLIRGTYDVFPSFAEPDYALAFRHLASNVRRRSLVVLFTSVVDEPNQKLAETLVRAMAGRHLPVCVWVRDQGLHDLTDTPATDAEGLYVRSAASEIVAWRERSLAAVRRRGAVVIDAAAADLTPALINRYMEIKARRLL